MPSLVSVGKPLQPVRKELEGRPPQVIIIDPSRDLPLYPCQTECTPGLAAVSPPSDSGLCAERSWLKTAELVHDGDPRATDCAAFEFGQSRP